MNVFEAIVLGILQGFTEFLPVSSSGHLVIAQALFGMDPSDLFFNVLLHGATLCSTIAIFRKRIASLFRSSPYVFQNTPKPEHQTNVKMIRSILFITFITGSIGLFAKDFFASFFQLSTLPITLSITGLILFLPKILKPREDQLMSGLSKKNVILMGLAQTLAIFPGISRSGTTISAGLLMNLKREDAGEFSFLISLPVIFGAFLLEVVKIESIELHQLYIYLFGFLSSFLAGIFALHFLLKWVRQGKLHYFSYYCWAMAIFLMIFTIG